MVRPAFFLWISIRSTAKRWRFPVPLFLVEDVLDSGLVLWRMGKRWLPRQQLPDLDALEPAVRQALAQVPRLLSTLRRAGPFTLLEVNDPASELEVTIKVV